MHTQVVVVVVVLVLNFIYFWNINNIQIWWLRHRVTNLLAHRCWSARNMNSKKTKIKSHTHTHTQSTDRVINNSSFVSNEYYINICDSSYGQFIGWTFLWYCLFTAEIITEWMALSALWIVRNRLRSFRKLVQWNIWNERNRLFWRSFF